MAQPLGNPRPDPLADIVSIVDRQLGVDANDQVCPYLMAGKPSLQCLDLLDAVSVLGDSADQSTHAGLDAAVK